VIRDAEKDKPGNAGLFCVSRKYGNGITLGKFEANKKPGFWPGLSGIPADL
jgi:hypothetical protein